VNPSGIVVGARRVGSRAGIARLVAIGYLLLAGGVAVFTWIGSTDDLHERIARNESLDYLDRLVAGGNGVVGSQAIVFEARARIPENETYRVVVGADFTDPDQYTAAYAADFLRYALFPRRPSDDARWIICYGCDRTRWGDRFELLFDAGGEITLGRLR
jgi:hypothetical protein